MPIGSPPEPQLKIEAPADGTSDVVDEGHEDEKSSSIKLFRWASNPCQSYVKDSQRSGRGRHQVCGTRRSNVALKVNTISSTTSINSSRRKQAPFDYSTFDMAVSKLQVAG